MTHKRGFSQNIGLNQYYFDKIPIFNENVFENTLTILLKLVFHFYLAVIILLGGYVH